MFSEKKRTERMLRASSSVKSYFMGASAHEVRHGGGVMSSNADEKRPDFLDVASWRRDYLHATLNRGELNPDPVAQFHKWFEEADSCPAVLESTAMVLSTSSASGEVSSRIVLLKGYDATGFRFFTNIGSRKALQIASNSSVSLLFYWEALERQIQINGRATQLPRSETEAYFASRPQGSRIGAWASRQSEVIEDRETLDLRVAEIEKRFEGSEVPAPDFWSGYLVIPESYEFWQGRPNRLHDRFQYRTSADGWVIERLSP
jgi:pyridoxamine 5'-phosphate oxidase